MIFGNHHSNDAKCLPVVNKRPVHTRHNLNAYLIRYWMMRIKYALVPSTLLKRQVDLSNLQGVSIT